MAIRQRRGNRRHSDTRENFAENGEPGCPPRLFHSGAMKYGNLAKSGGCADFGEEARPAARSALAHWAAGASPVNHLELPPRLTPHRRHRLLAELDLEDEIGSRALWIVAWLGQLTCTPRMSGTP